MADKLYIVGGGSLTDIAEAIREKNPNAGEMTVAEMPRNIREIPSGGGGEMTPIGSKTIPYMDGDTGAVPLGFSNAYMFFMVVYEYYGVKNAFWIVVNNGTAFPTGFTVQEVGAECGYDWGADTITLTIAEPVSNVVVNCYTTEELYAHGGKELLAFFGLVK